jgi:hypothetical protein
MRTHALLSGALLLFAFAPALAGPPLMTFKPPGKGGGCGGGGAISVGPRPKPDRGKRAKDIIKHWSKDKLKSAKPRDLVVDATGAGFFKDSTEDATPGVTVFGPKALRPYGALLPAHLPAAKQTTTFTGVDVAAPFIDNVSPKEGQTVPSSSTFSARVTDKSGVKTVTFVVTKGTSTWSFKPSYMGGDTYSLTLYGFWNGDWSFFVKTTDQVPLPPSAPPSP